MLRASTLNACHRSLLHARWAGTEAGGPEEDRPDVAVVHRNSLSSECFNFGKEHDSHGSAGISVLAIGREHGARTLGATRSKDEGPFPQVASS